MCGEKIFENRKDGCLSRCISRNVRQNGISPFGESRTIVGQRKSGSGGKCLQFRPISEGENQENINAFKGRNYTYTWCELPGWFDVEYKPTDKKLEVKLPVYFRLFFNKNRADYFIENVQNTWSNKYKMRTTATKKRQTEQNDVEVTATKERQTELNDVEVNATEENWQTELNDVEVNVKVERADKRHAYFKIGESADVSSVSSKSEVNLRNGAFQESKDSENSSRDESRYNIYGHEAGHMFGLDDEYQIKGDYKIGGNLRIYDKANLCVNTYMLGQSFSYEGNNYEVHQVKSDEIRGILSWKKLVIGGEKYACNQDFFPNAGDVILLNMSLKKRSDALPGTLTDHYDYTKDALLDDYANEYATMDDARNESSKTIMGNGTEVKRHHYVMFWKAMTMAIAGGNQNSDDAPNTMTDWEIVE